MRVAAIDCGTNSVRLLIAEADGQGGMREIDRRLELTRLGQGVDATGEFHPDALARTFEALDGYAAAIGDAGVDRVRFVATSAARDAKNKAAFVAGVRERLGVEPEVIPGEEEARLSFRGARSGVPGATDPVLVVDIGGGSTELVLGEGDEVAAAVSLDVGSVRLRERFLHHDPPTPAQATDALAFVDGLLDGCAVDLTQVGTFVGVAGTMTTLSGAVQRLPEYDRAQVHGSRLSPEQLAGIRDDMLGWTVAETMQMCPSIPQKRAEVIVAGAIIAAAIAERVGEPVIISEADILDGVALGLLDG